MSEDRRQAIVAAVSDHLLREGFANSGIRALAKSSGVSDRMLMYYFETKEELISAALLHLALAIFAKLEEILPQKRASQKQIVDALVNASQSSDVQPALRLWFEIVGLAMRDDGTYRATANVILDGWEAWVEQRLGPKQAHLAPQVLAQIEGQLLVLLLRG